MKNRLCHFYHLFIYFDIPILDYYDLFWYCDFLSSEMENWTCGEKANPLHETSMHIRCVMKGNQLGISPARHSLSDRRINSSHGNSIFIFQGQRFPFFPSSCQRVEKIFWANSLLFGSERKEKKRRANEYCGEKEMQSPSLLGKTGRHFR